MMEEALWKKLTKSSNNFRGIWLKEGKFSDEKEAIDKDLVLKIKLESLSKIIATKVSVMA